MKKAIFYLLAIFFLNLSPASADSGNSELAYAETDSKNCNTTNIVNQSNELKATIDKYQKDQAYSHEAKMILFSLYNLWRIKKYWKLAELYLQKNNHLSKFAKKEIKDAFIGDLFDITMAMCQLDLAYKMEKVDKENKKALYVFWLSTTMIADLSYISLSGYRFCRWMFPSAAKIAARKARAIRNKQELTELLTKAAIDCLQNNSPELVKRCNQVFASYTRVCGAEALNRLKEALS